MKATVKKIKDCRIRLSVEVDAGRFDERYREVLKSFQKEARLPGFREGKAPVDLVEKKYSKEAEEETLKSLIPEVYRQAVESQKLTPVSLPSISDIQCERGKKLAFSAEFDTAPEFSLKNYKGIKLKRVPIDVLADDVEKGVQSLLESRAELVPLVEPRAVRHGDFILTDIEIWKGGQYAPGKKGVLLYAEPHETDDFYDKIIGAGIDEVREVSVDMSPEEKEKGLVGRKPYYKIWVRGIQEKKLPALDEAFAKSFGQESVEALREAVRKDLARHKTGESQAKMKNELFGKLLALVSFPVPPALVEKQEERLLEQARREFAQMGMPADRLEAELESVRAESASKAADQVRLYFILQKVAEAEKIDVDEIEVEKRLAALAEESKRPMDEVRRVFEDDLRESMLEKATVDFLLANAKFEEAKS
ncbi:MAG TPA: trigger factor [Candidatus Eisenbacteria bacterium]|jgi:trigger factor|nr:trigger factor [Candidatus Eisenbacteria bacterium]